MVDTITAVVCSYQRASCLESCLASLERQDLNGLQLLVVAVEGDTKTEDVIKESSVEAVFQPRPEGISVARNLGIWRSRTDVVAFIDDDARARPRWASSLMSALSVRGVGAAGGPVFDTRTGQQVVRPWWVDAYGVTHDEVGPDRDSRIPTLNGCNMAFQRNALLAIGGFDPYYRYYFDETDVCVRLWRSGYAVRYSENATVDHDFAEGPTRGKFLYSSSRMRAYFSMKNFGASVSKGRLLLGQATTLRKDFRAYRRLRGKYVGIGGFRRAVQELAVGRLEGILDGLSASHARRCPLRDSREEGIP